MIVIRSERDERLEALRKDFADGLNGFVATHFGVLDNILREHCSAKEAEDGLRCRQPPQKGVYSMPAE